MMNKTPAAVAFFLSFARASSGAASALEEEVIEASCEAEAEREEAEREEAEARAADDAAWLLEMKS